MALIIGQMAVSQVLGRADGVPDSFGRPLIARPAIGPVAAPYRSGQPAGVLSTPSSSTNVSPDAPPATSPAVASTSSGGCCG